ncbi:hypothetical protein I3760_01G290700 [Carya illinoinensis]|nr:hypothetical protein I3760_01G290700 [Carya illinoinensis]
MSESVTNPEAWLPLPLKFLTNEDVLMDKENFNKSAPSIRFPSEFPYEFESFGSNSSLSSPVESVASSTETESSDEDDFFAGLTRRLAQSSLHETQKLTVPSLSRNKRECVIAGGSPQSTLTGIGSWSGRSAVSSNGSPNGPSRFPSPPTTPFGASNDTWDLIYAAAGQVARLKVSSESPKYNYQNRGLLAPPKLTTPASTENGCNIGLYSNHGLSHNLPQTTQSQHVRQGQVLKPQCAASIWGRQYQEKAGWSTQNQQELQSRNCARNTVFESGRCGPCGRPVSTVPLSAWPSPHSQPQHQPPRHTGPGNRAVVLGGSGGKRECAGTGVFLPRRYGSSPDIRKKTCCPAIIVPAKVVQSLNLNLDDISSHVQPRYHTGFTSEHDFIMTGGNALMTQQRRSIRPEGSVSHEIRLPQDWTY